MTAGDSTVLQGRWRIGGLLARGGSARVFRGVDTRTEREVALKILDLADVEDWKQVELFERQLPILRGLRHRGIPEVYDAFEHVDDGRTQLVLVQALHHGPNLRDALAGEVRFDDRTARAFLGRMLDILEYLHGLSPPILHRDIKPANILLEVPEGGDLADAQPILIDFDTARGLAIDPAVSDGTMVGSAGYVPLEQLAGRPVPASDIYALGMTVIAALSRREVTDLPVERSKVMFRAFVNISDQLASVLERMVEPIVEDRLADVAAVRRALAAPTATPRSQKRPFTLATLMVLLAIASAIVITGAILMREDRAPPRAQPSVRPSPSPSPSPTPTPEPPRAQSLASRRILDAICTSDPPCHPLLAPNTPRFLGQSVAVSGSTLAIGAGYADGAVYVFTRDATSWREQAVLESPHAQQHPQFGHAVALEGDTLVVGARLAYQRRGGVFIYVREGERWQLQEDLTGSREESRFGQAIALSGDTLAVYEADRGDAVISLFVRRDGEWTEQQQLRGFRGLLVAFSLDRDTLAVSAPNGASDDRRSAIHVYRRTGEEWVRESVVHTRASVDSVALAGDSMVTPSRDPARPGVLILGRDKGTWTEDAFVELPRRQPASAVALSGDRMAVVSFSRTRNADGSELDQTEVSLFSRLRPSFRFERGLATELVEKGPIALDGDTLVLGAPQITASNGERQYWPGAAFVFSLRDDVGRAR